MFLEPYKISSAIKKLNLKHAVITSVDRDDLSDGGAYHFYKVIIETKIKRTNKAITIAHINE